MSLSGAPIDRAVAIIGMAGRFPSASDPQQMWDGVLAGRDAITRATVPTGDTAAGRTMVAARGTLMAAEHFDAEFFGYTHREAVTADPQQRLLLECVWSALEDAGLPPNTTPGTGLYVGVRANGYAALTAPAADKRHPVESLLTSMGTDPSFFATRISYALGLSGASLTVQTACSSSLVAVHLAVEALRRGECPLAVVAGASVQADRDLRYEHVDGSILSADGRCRPFDADASGTVPGEGVAAVVLKLLPDALAAGDDVYAVVRGSAVNNDGRAKVGYTAPSVAGQVGVLRAALADASLDPADIDYVQAHGTGTALGDPIELRALAEVYGPGRERPLILGAVKANIGHLDVVSGLAGLIATALAVREARIPPLTNFRTPNPEAPGGTLFEYPATASAWPAVERARGAAVSSFGVGGTNVHVVLEQSPDAVVEPVAGTPRHELLTVSARTSDVADELAERMSVWLEDHPRVSVADVAKTLWGGRAQFAHRRAWIMTDGGENRAVVKGSAPDAKSLAYVYSGQGSQRAGLLAGVLRRLEHTRGLSTAVHKLLAEVGPAVRHFLIDSPQVGENPTGGPRLAQLAVFAADCAMAAALGDWGLVPAAVAGNSIGEYAAACAAGVFTPEDAAELIGVRAELAADLCEPGRMIAVAAGLERVRPHLGAGTWPAVDTAPRRCTISGTVAGIETLRTDLHRVGVVSRVLPVDRAYHSPLMEPMAEAFVKQVAARDLQPPRITLVSAVTGASLSPDDACSPEYWGVRHLLAPVQLGAVVDVLAATGALLVNVGPYDGAVCRAHAGQRGSEVAATMPVSPSDLDSEEALLAAIADLWVAGADVATPRNATHRVHLPTYPFAGPRFWPDPGQPSGPSTALSPSTVATPEPPAAADTRTPEKPASPEVPASTPTALPDEDVLGAVTEIFQEVLGDIEPGPDASFFASGGDSLTATQVLARVRDGFGVILTLRDFFDQPTPSGLARQIIFLNAQEES